MEKYITDDNAISWKLVNDWGNSLNDQMEVWIVIFKTDDNNGQQEKIMSDLVL